MIFLDMQSKAEKQYNEQGSMVANPVAGSMLANPALGASLVSGQCMRMEEG